jgi:pyruvate dehydrogenase E1 component beta subunit
LRAPVRRVTLPDSPAPVSKPLEDVFHPTPMTIAQACLDVLRQEVQVQSHVGDVQAAFAGPY